MGWLPEIPHQDTNIECWICKKELVRTQPYYIIWSPDIDDPDSHPDNLYYICQDHRKDAMKVNTCCIKVKTNCKWPRKNIKMSVF